MRVSRKSKCWPRSEEHTSELQSRGLISYAVFCLKKKMEPDQPRHDALPPFGSARGELSSPNVPFRLPTCGPHCDLSLYLSCGFPVFVFFNDTATTEIYTLSLHDALPI